MSITGREKMTRYGIMAACIGLTLAGCDNRDDAPPPDPAATASPSPDAPVSIIRPDIEVERAPVAMERLRQRIGFPDGGSELDDTAIAALEEIIASPQLAAGGAIVLRAHSDAGGSDDANMRASQARGEAVRDWLVENGVEEDRIEVIAFGEQNPVEPNALPDGEPNEEGRAANRRVAITVEVPEGATMPDPASSKPSIPNGAPTASPTPETSGTD